MGNQDIEFMATQIASGIFQNNELVEECRELAELSKNDGEKRSLTQYIGILAVDTAYWIREYARAKMEAQSK